MGSRYKARTMQLSEFVRTHPTENPHGVGMLGDIKEALKSATDLVRILFDVEPVAILRLASCFFFEIYQMGSDYKARTKQLSEFGVGMYGVGMLGVGMLGVGMLLCV